MIAQIHEDERGIYYRVDAQIDNGKVKDGIVLEGEVVEEPQGTTA